MGPRRAEVVEGIGAPRRAIEGPQRRREHALDAGRERRELGLPQLGPQLAVRGEQLGMAEPCHHRRAEQPLAVEALVARHEVVRLEPCAGPPLGSARERELELEVVGEQRRGLAAAQRRRQQAQRSGEQHERQQGPQHTRQSHRCHEPSPAPRLVQARCGRAAHGTV